MRNPIFSADTLFLDQSTTGAVTYRSGEENGEVAGAKIIKLETKQALVELRTESGRSLIMSPETAFSLHKDEGGALQIYAPVNTEFQNSEHLLNWNVPPFMPSEHCRFAIAGMICANGTHSFARSRATSFSIHSSGATIGLNKLVPFLDTLSNNFATQHHWKKPPVVNIKAVEGGGIFIRSTAITSYIGNLLTERTQNIAFDFSLIGIDLRWAFLRGLLSTSRIEGEDIVFQHRSAATVKTVAQALWSDFGVPSKLVINPMEAAVTPTRTGAMPHHFRMSAEHRAAARTAGLDPEGPTKVSSFYHDDRITHVAPIDRKVPAVIVVPSGESRHPLTANSFVFSPQFSLPSAVVEIAASPIFVDSSDPTRF